MLTFIDFFAGIGGFRLGMEMAGHKCLGHCEIDKFANKSYIAMHRPKEDEWFGEDIRNTRADELPRADVWCFGFPCQDISVAGKQTGFRGNRSSLFFTVTKLIRELKEEDRPRYLFIENVKNLLSVNRGFDFAKLLIELDEIGYDAEWQVLNSKNFGVPQNRERVFIIGHLRGRSGRKVFPIGGTAEATDINIIGTTDIRTVTENKQKRNVVLGIDGICNCLSATDYKQPKQIALKQLIGGSDAQRVYAADGLARTLKAEGGGQGAKTGLYLIGNINPSGKGMNGQVYDSKGISPTITTNKGEGRKIAICKNDIRIRRLTPKECFRLQGFPDEYFERARQVNSDSQLYKQAGNSVTVNVIYAIAQKL